MDRARDTSRLREYETELVDAVLNGNQRDVDALKEIVTGYRRALDVRGTTPSAKPVPSAKPQSPSRLNRRQRRQQGQPGLKRILKGFLEERGRLTVEETLAALSQLPRYADGLPARNTVVSRYSDLVQEGVALAEGGGVYALLGDENQPAPTLNGGSFGHSTTVSETEP